MINTLVAALNEEERRKVRGMYDFIFNPEQRQRFDSYVRIMRERRGPLTADELDEIKGDFWLYCALNIVNVLENPKIFGDRLRALARQSAGR